MPRPKPIQLIDSHVPEHPWYEGGLCTLPYDGEPLTTIFYSEDEDDIAMAKQVCAACEIRALCLETSLANKEPEGVWGGLSAPERRSLQRKRRRATVVA